MNGVNAKLGDTFQAPESPQRRLYVLSANDKPSLLSQMEALGMFSTLCRTQDCLVAMVRGD